MRLMRGAIPATQALHTGARAEVRFRFKYHAEYVLEGATFLFREVSVVARRVRRALVLFSLTSSPPRARSLRRLRSHFAGPRKRDRPRHAVSD